MAFQASVKYVAQLDPSTFQLVDTSPYAGSDSKANFSARTLTILRSDSTALPGYPNPINFPYGGGDTFTISGLTQDWALKIVITLTPITPVSGSTYVGETDVATTRFLQQGLFNIQVQRLNDGYPSSAAEKVYRTNSIDLIIETQNSQAAMIYSNYVGAQDALNRGQNILNNLGIYSPTPTIVPSQPTNAVLPYTLPFILS